LPQWIKPQLTQLVDPGFIGCGRSSSPKSNILTWTDDNLLRQVVYEGLREDKPAAEVRRAVPHAKL
jgi:hypothetical protein